MPLCCVTPAGTTQLRLGPWLIGGRFSVAATENRPIIDGRVLRGCQVELDVRIRGYSMAFAHGGSPAPSPSAHRSSSVTTLADHGGRDLTSHTWLARHTHRRSIGCSAGVTAGEQAVRDRLGRMAVPVRPTWTETRMSRP